MAANQIVTGYQFCFDKFKDAAPEFQAIIKLVQDAGFMIALGLDTRIYNEHIADFFNNGKILGENISSTVKGAYMEIDAKDVTRILEFPAIAEDGINNLYKIDISEALEFFEYKKKDDKEKGLKKKNFPPKYEFLADIVGKCLLCKDSAYDAVNDTQLRLMYAIAKGIKVNYGVVIFDWLKVWLEMALKREKQKKPAPKMFYGRFLSLILKNSPIGGIDESAGVILNVNKKMTSRLFENWKKNPVEILRSRQSGESDRTVTEVNKPTKEGDKEVSEPKKKKAVKRKLMIEESSGSANQKPTEEASTADQPSEKQPPIPHNLTWGIRKKVPQIPPNPKPKFIPQPKSKPFTVPFYPPSKPTLSTPTKEKDISDDDAPLSSLRKRKAATAVGPEPIKDKMAGKDSKPEPPMKRRKKIAHKGKAKSVPHSTSKPDTHSTSSTESRRVTKLISEVVKDVEQAEVTQQFSSPPKQTVHEDVPASTQGELIVEGENLLAKTAEHIREDDPLATIPNFLEQDFSSGSESVPAEEIHEEAPEAAEAESPSKKEEVHLYDFLVCLPTLKARATRDYSWVSWGLKRCTNIYLVAQQLGFTSKCSRYCLENSINPSNSSSTYHKITYVNTRFFQLIQSSISSTFQTEPSHSHFTNPSPKSIAHYPPYSSPPKTPEHNYPRSPSPFHISTPPSSPPPSPLVELDDTTVVELTDSPIVELSNSTSDDSNPPSPNLKHTSKFKSSIPLATTSPTSSHSLTLTNIPSSSQNTPKIPRPSPQLYLEHFPEPPRNPDASLENIMDRLQNIPTTIQVDHLLNSHFSDVVQGLETVGKGLDQGLSSFGQSADAASQEMIKQIRKLMATTIHDIAENLKARDKVFFDALKEQREAIVVIQNRNEESIKQLSNKVMDLSSSISNFKESYQMSNDMKTTVLMDQIKKSDKRFDELNDDNKLSREQLSELVKSVQALTSEVQTLSTNVADDKKGEKYKKSSSARPSSNTAAQTSTSRPPPSAVPLGPGSSSRPSSSFHPQSEVTPVGGRLTSGDPNFINRQLQGVHIEGEERFEMPDLGPRASAEEMIQLQQQGAELYRQRREAERRDPPKPKRKPPVRYTRRT